MKDKQLLNHLQHRKRRQDFSRKPRGELELVVIGSLPGASKGLTYLFKGNWEVHAEHGGRVRVAQCEEVESASPDGFRLYLASSISGLGPKTTQLLIEHFGDNLKSVLECEDAEKQLVKVKGVGRKIAAKIKEGWNKNQGQRDAMVFMEQFRNIPHALRSSVVSNHGNKTEERILKDPHLALLDMRQYAFRWAEHIAEQIHSPADSPSRVMAAMLSVLHKAAFESGQMCLHWDAVNRKTLQLLTQQGSPSSWSMREGMALGVLTGKLVVERGYIGDVVRLKDVRKTGDSHLGEEVWYDGQQLLKAARSSSLQGVTSLMTWLDKVTADILPGSDRVIGPSADLGEETSSDEDEVSRLADLNGSPVQNRGVGPVSSIPVAPSDLPLRFYLSHLYGAEVDVCSYLIQAMRSRSLSKTSLDVNKWIVKYEKENSVSFSTGQRAALVLASHSPVTIITGGPGCGKTFAVKALVRLWMDLGLEEVNMCAPTGRAAQRLKEVVDDARCQSQTIHRLLGYRPRKSFNTAAQDQDGRGSGMDMLDDEDDEKMENSCTFNTFNPLSGQATLVDEVSMMDMSLAAALMNALPRDPGHRLVMVGDPDQLPPVGPGAVLRAAIKSHVVPVVDLRQIFRQAQGSAIITGAHAINRGELPTFTRWSWAPNNPCPPRSVIEQSDALHIVMPRSSSPEAVEGEILHVLRELLPGLGYNPLTDVQILTPTKKGPGGTHSLNPQLQPLLNPRDDSKGEMRMYGGTRSGSGDAELVWRVGDRVIHVRNDYDKNVYNGDLGTVVEVDEAHRRMVVRYPPRPEEEEDHEVEYEGSSLYEDVQMAWATTVHKAQGGEFPVVVIPVHEQIGRWLLSRTLLYTAVTRAKKLLVLVGTDAGMKMAVEREESSTRGTSSLESRLQHRAQMHKLPFHGLQVFR